MSDQNIRIRIWFLEEVCLQSTPKMASDGAVAMSSGSSLHIRDPGIWKVRSPTAERLKVGTTKRLVLADRKARLLGGAATRTKGQRYGGDMPCIRLVQRIWSPTSRLKSIKASNSKIASVHSLGSWAYVCAACGKYLMSQNKQRNHNNYCRHGFCNLHSFRTKNTQLRSSIKLS